MTTAAAPIPIRQTSSSSSPSSSPSSFFQLPTKKRRQHRLMEQRKSEEAAVLQEETALRAQAWIYLDDFLQNSEWSEQLDRITIVSDAVPTMPELNAFGDLDEKEGTRACRRLFKAVVIWDELGHSLWKTLRAASEQRQLAQRQFELGTSRRSRFPDEVRATTSYTSRRPSRRTSEDSYDSCFSLESGDSQDSAHSYVPPVPPLPASVLAEVMSEKKPRIRLSKRFSRSSRSASWSSSSSRRSSCDMEQPSPEHLLFCDQHHRQQEPDLGISLEGFGEPSPSGFPIMYANNRAVRKRLGIFDDFGTSPPKTSAGRPSHSPSVRPNTRGTMI
ncbi:hypothetical protein HIM_05921 [Hirsutella minnesotensis 3608]|uniref:Uncharacterized protein n=1 Tax=Hirsutella minnesotensis 3608 TaxID=1043627 RepID=A0A0F7ZJN4_9HYPO|nr:hypothetical protein HIM_05921 [Hirsutella minnesotensis 3608]